jgi:protein TonB
MSHGPFANGWTSLPDASARERRNPVLTAAVSIGLHAAVLAAIVVVPLLSVGSLPDAGTEVKAFFAPPLELAPPPPPPPPPSSPARAAARTPVEAPQNPAFTVPVETPAPLASEDAIDLRFEGGVPGGVEGGVPGGVVGGVVGGLPEAPPPPPVKPLRAGLHIAEPRKVRDVPPVYPMTAVMARLEGVVVIECLLDVRGRVQETKVLRGVPLLDEAALEAVRQWAYTPTLVNGEPVPVVLTVTVRFQLKPGR